MASRDHEPSTSALGWQDMESVPDVGRKFIALYDDGSGACMFWRGDDVLIDQDGDEHPWSWPRVGIARWAYLPDELEFWCENFADDPVTLRLPPKAEAQS